MDEKILLKIANPKKFKIIKALEKGRMNGLDLKKETGLTTGTLYYHLNDLNKKGIIQIAHIKFTVGDETIISLKKLSHNTNKKKGGKTNGWKRKRWSWRN